MQALGSRIVMDVIALLHFGSDSSYMKVGVGEQNWVMRDLHIYITDG